jgi:hypothetical protein
MKVFFTTSLRGKKYFDTNYKKIYKELEGLGFKHLDYEISELVISKFYDELGKQGEDAYTDLYSRKTNRVSKADICVFECSVQSFSIGLLVEKALELQKPTIILYYKDNVPYFLAGINDPKLIVTGYTTKNLKEVLTESIEQAKQQRSTRFNFFITPELLVYVEKTSRKMNKSKSAFIRDLIEDHKRKNSK